MLEDEIAGRMAERVVYLLETVEIDLKQGEFLVVGSLLPLAQVLVQIATIGQAGQVIVKAVVFRLELDFHQGLVLVLGRFAGVAKFNLPPLHVGHVGNHFDDVTVAGFRHGDAFTADRGGSDAVLRLIRVSFGVKGPAGGEDLPVIPVHRVGNLRRQALPGRKTDDVVLVEGKQVTERPVDECISQRAVPGRNGCGDCIENEFGKLSFSKHLQETAVLFLLLIDLVEHGHDIGLAGLRFRERLAGQRHHR